MYQFYLQHRPASQTTWLAITPLELLLQLQKEHQGRESQMVLPYLDHLVNILEDNQHIQEMFPTQWVAC
ncbi:hypothetical protein B296_00050460 [Ensete ventricosum]|uniref:Uncharacterized protein n=1 Tax=Ensete ventricosum TaxID=4639 RepID=A0A426XV85_ENSVE|nr:hypothetical protein B296_00050460 [Ensete ventricosum]